MLKGTNYWDTGYMDLYLNNKPQKVYVPPGDPQRVYELSQNMIANDGKIPIGIDHLSEDVIKTNPILQKLDLLHVGDITAVEFNEDTNSVSILEATFTNPLIQELYDNGELDAVSIVSEVTTRPCPKENGVEIISTEKLKRVDIVGVGACDSCRIPLNQSKTMVYARKPIKEENNMSEEAITKDGLQELLNAQAEEFNKTIDELKAEYEAKIEELKKEADPIEPTTNGESAEIAAMKAEIEALKETNKAREEKAILSAANARVDLAINQGKILPAQKESYVELAASKPEAFDEMMKNQPVIVDVNKRVSLVAGHSLDNDTDPEPTKEEQNMNSVLNHFKGDD